MAKQFHIENTGEKNGKVQARCFDSIVNSHRVANGLTPIIKSKNNTKKG